MISRAFGIGKTNLESNGVRSRISQSQKLGRLICQRSCLSSVDANWVAIGAFDTHCENRALMVQVGLTLWEMGDKTL